MKNLDLVKNKYKFLIIPAVIILAGIIMYFVNGGFNYDIEFMGGVKMEIAMDGNPDTEEIKNFLETETGLSPIIVQSTENGISIKTKAVEEKERAEEPADEAAVADETATTDEVAAADETATTDETAVADETATTDEIAAADETVTTDETAAADETATTDETAVADEATEETVLNHAKDENAAKIFEVLKAKYNLSDEALLSESSASASFGKQVQSKTLLFTFIAILCILAYIAFRFEWRSAVMSVIALVINILIMMAVYAISYTPLNTTFIAAMLTVIGYSINNTIVVFDRIRENMKNRNPKRGITVSTIVNNSIKESMGRTLNTTITTLITIVLLYIIGVTSIKEFAFPLIIGVLAGAYSSIFIASTFWANWKENALNAKKQRK